MMNVQTFLLWVIYSVIKPKKSFPTEVIKYFKIKQGNHKKKNFLLTFL